MASIVLSIAGSAAGSATGIPGANMIGSQIGRMVGSFIDQRLFGGSANLERSGPRLSDLAVQSSAYGRMIPIVYGTARIAGNIIWSQPIKERATTAKHSASGGKGGGGKVTQSTTTYSYSVSMAIGLCEGEVTRCGGPDATACTVSGMFCSFPAGETPEQSCGNNETFGDCVFAPTTCFIIFATDRLGIARPGRQVCGCDGQTYKGGSGAA